MSIFILILFKVLVVDGYDSGKNCTVGERTFKSGTFFRHQLHFNVSCEDGKMKVCRSFQHFKNLKFQVVNCLTQRGTKIPLGTLSFPEDGKTYCQFLIIKKFSGFNYTCKDVENAGNAPKLTPINDEKLAEECEHDQSQVSLWF